MTSRSADAADPRPVTPRPLTPRGRTPRPLGAVPPIPNRKRWFRRITWIVAAVVAVSTITALALQTQGYRSAEVDLGDWAVWVTNGEGSLVGRVNGQIEELNSAVTVSPDFEVLQGGSTVLVLDRTQDVLRPIDVGAVSLQPQIALPVRALVEVGANVVAIADQDSGRIWAGELTALAGLDPTVADPQLATGVNPVIAVSTAGTVFAAAPGSDKLWTLDLTDPAPARPPPDSSRSTDQNQSGSAVDNAAGRSPAATDPEDLPPLPGGRRANPPRILPGGALSATAVQDTAIDDDGLSIAAIGEVPVILDRAAGQLITPTLRIAVPNASTAVLQTSGPGSEEVLIATADSLLAVSLAAGSVRALATGLMGRPAAPVRVADCALGVWSDTAGTFVRTCGQQSAQVLAVPDSNATAGLQLRVLNGLAVLNDHATGKVWSVKDAPRRIDNWDDVIPLSITDETTSSQDGEQTSNELTSVRADCVSDPVDPPRPTDKTYGVRAGRTTVLSVLDDAASSDCSMLALVKVAEAGPPPGNPTPWRVDIVNNGQALQVSVPAEFSGNLPALTYTVSDGINPAATAALEIEVVGPDTVPAPVKIRDSVVEVELGGSVTYNVLQDYVSPGGDDLFLTAATVGTEDEVTFKPDGTVTFVDKGTGGVIAKEVELVISDGVNSIAGRLVVDVRAVGSAKPLASPVYARTVVGEPLTVWPLRSVISPSAEPVLLSRVWAKSADPATSAIGNPATGSVVVSSKNAGTNYFLYAVAVDGKSTTGVLRVDVVERPAAAVPPIPMTDIVYLPAEGAVTIDPTTNDSDPMAGGLAVAQTEVPALGSLNVAITDMHLIRVSAPRPLPAVGGTFNYTVSNGFATAVGQVRVVQVPAPADPLPPVAFDTSITVRAGDAATMPISSLALDPNGDLLSLIGITDDTLDPGQGVLFSTGSALRYLAPETVPTGAVQFAYTVINSGGRKASALVNISVTPQDGRSNAAPRIPAVTVARVFAGSTVSVQTPLDGIDPDGDWTTISGISQPSTAPLGEVAVDGPQTISYRAFAVPGVDTFGYSAVDPFGQAVIGVVKVVVVARPTTISPPLAPDLVLDIRPGRTVGVDVLSDIQDGGGEVVELADPAFTASANLTVTVEDSLLVVTAPNAESVENIKYNVERAGLSASGVITVRISPTAVVKPPTAADIFVTDVMLSADGSTAAVDVSDRIGNPGGRVRELVLDMNPAAAGQATVVGARELSIPLTESRQVLSYRVTNRTDELSAQAFIVLPSRAAAQAQARQVVTAPPQLKAGVAPLRVNAGETKTVLVADYVTVATGLTAQLPAGSALAASQGQITRVDNATFRFAAGVDDGGDAVVTLTVTDGVNTAAAIGIPVTIVPKVPALALLSSTSLEIEVGKSKIVDLLPLTVPGDAKQAKILVYSSESNSAGFTASLDGSKLTVSVAADVQRGSVGSITVSVVDDLARMVTASVTVAASGSTEPLATLNLLTLRGRPGVEVVADVLAGAFNPFAGPLTLKSDVLVESGNAVARVSGTQVFVTPTPGQSGQVVVSFTVGDSTNDPSREVTGRLVVVVADRPDKPGTPTVLTTGNGQVQLTWTESSDRGSPIVGYRVSYAGGTANCAQNPCLIDGLTNNVSYAFTVTAINSIGESDPSAASAAARPDATPNKPGAPVAVYAGSGVLQVSWSNPGSSGSPITSYDVEISPADSGGRTSMSVTELGVTWDRLTNGTGYQFRVRANNGAGQPGPWSEFSNTQTPAAPPSAPAPPTLTAAGDGSSITVTWEEPQTNGAPITGYLIGVNDGNGPAVAVDVGTTTSYVFPNSEVGQTYSFTVTASNRAGAGPPSATTSVTPYLSPGTVELTGTATGNDGEVELSWTTATDIGAMLSQYELTTPDGTQQVLTTNYIWTGTNGAAATFSVRPCYAVLNTCGADSNVVTVTPYGDVTAPTDLSIAAVSTTAITFSWTVPADNGHGPMTTEYSTDNGGSWIADGATTYTFNGACGSGPYEIQVRGVDAAGVKSVGVAQASGNIAACPPVFTPVITVTKTGDANGQPGCSVPECRYLRVSGTGFPPNIAVTCTVTAPNPPVPFAAQPFSTDPDGAGVIDNVWYYGTSGEILQVSCTDGTNPASQVITW